MNPNSDSGGYSGERGRYKSFPNNEEFERRDAEAQSFPANVDET